MAINETTPKTTTLTEERDRLAVENGYSSFAAVCEHDQLLQEQITQLAKQNLGYIV